jgi:eukaryotic-like serine/threonine-protein kinase
MSATHGDRDPLDLLAEEFVERHRRGEAPSVAQYASRYPHFAEQIRRTFPAALMLERLKPSSTEVAISGDSRRSFGTLKLDRLGDYRVVREVGRGGMAVVYEAEQVSLGRRVALKVLPNLPNLNETLLRRFELEARAAARLHHTNIVPVFGVGEEGGLHYYVMQFIHGQGLDAVLS